MQKRASASPNSVRARNGSAGLQPLTVHPFLLAARRVAAVAGVKAYLESPLRLEKVNNNNLG